MILMKYHTLFFLEKMAQNLSSVAVVISALRVKHQTKQTKKLWTVKKSINTNKQAEWEKNRDPGQLA